MHLDDALDLNTQSKAVTSRIKRSLATNSLIQALCLSSFVKACKKNDQKIYCELTPPLLIPFSGRTGTPSRNTCWHGIPHSRLDAARKNLTILTDCKSKRDPGYDIEHFSLRLILQTPAHVKSKTTANINL